MLKNKRIVLGVTGGVAAYKAVETARLLIKEEAVVDVVMTEAATRFVAPLTFEAVTGRRPSAGIFSDGPKSGVRHIDLAREADCILVAPATAQSIARMALGLADDLLSCIILATEKPVIVAPSMNSCMYLNPATQKNLRTLESRGFVTIEPETGWLACGEEGVGRLPEPRTIVERVIDVLKKSSDLAGKRIVVTAGGTREPIDPVRFVGNKSSGAMGIETAKALLDRGADVTLVLANVDMIPPGGADVVRVETAREMLERTVAAFEKADGLVMTAAVADYAPKSPKKAKIKKAADTLTVELEKTPDVLAEVAKKKGGRFVVGFAAETEHVVASARKKLAEKKLDLIVANDVSTPGAGFGSDRLDAIIIPASGAVLELGVVDKKEVARIIAARVEQATSE
ncbi:MAG: bifunctional phosphopantothenoylcysteine decarboxylase/phosphopantothenate--cysteine ligase CoaBC [Candidatus Aquicultorales bacterium]